MYLYENLAILLFTTTIVVFFIFLASSFLFKKPLFSKIKIIILIFMTGSSLAMYSVPFIKNTIFGNICHSKGGDWNQTGFDLAYRCQIPAIDAGKVCTDGSQCSYGICTGGVYGQPPPLTGQCMRYKEESFEYKNNQQGIAPLAIFF